MADPKITVPLEDIVDQPLTQETAPEQTQPAAGPVKKTRWTFVKQHGVTQNLVFRDKSTFKFPLIPLNDNSGFAVTSEVTIDDEKLANNLRSLPAGAGVVEVK